MGETIKIRLGCLTLFLSFVIGAMIGYCVSALKDRYMVHYIDRDTAVQYGLENAQAHCQDAHYAPPVDCQHFKVTSEQEDRTGWFFTFTSADGKVIPSMWIGRRGEYDGTGLIDPENPDIHGTEGASVVRIDGDLQDQARQR